MAHRGELKALLGEGGATIAEGADITAWQPSLDYKPKAYYWMRSLDEPDFRALVTRAGFLLGPVPAVPEGVWTLPPDIKFAGWTPQAVPAGAGLQANGNLGRAAVWLRWFDGRMYAVALRSSE